MLPLYENDTRNWEILFQQAQTAHIGLLFDKFPHGEGWADKSKAYQPAVRVKDKNDDNKEKSTKQLFLESIIRKYRQNEVALTANLSSTIDTQKKLIEQKKGLSLTATTQWRFVSGLGASHPFETGFIWHRTLSVPYLPGSSVKGMMRAWAEQWGGLVDQNEINRLFGPRQEQSESAESGAVIVFDALPSKPPKLELDILNPHYSEYYHNPSTPPADYLSPIPVFFLAVAEGQSFEFCLAPRNAYYRNSDNQNHNANDDLITAITLLQEALSNLGAGGKTAVGYGLFKESRQAELARIAKNEAILEQKESESKDAETQATLSEKGYSGLSEAVYRKAHQENWETCISTLEFYQTLLDTIDSIMAEPDAKIQQDAIAIVSDILKKKYPRILENPGRTEGKKAKPAYKPKQIEIAKKLLTITKTQKS